MNEWMNATVEMETLMIAFFLMSTVFLIFYYLFKHHGYKVVCSTVFSALNVPK